MCTVTQLQETPAQWSPDLPTHTRGYGEVTTNEKKAMDLKESGKAYMGRFRGRKGKGEMLLCYNPPN